MTQATKPTRRSAAKLVALLEHPTRRDDAEVLLALLAKVTGEKPVVWGEKMIGFGRYAYDTAAGTSGIWFRLGFSAQKTKLVVYVLPGYSDHGAILARLGKHKLGRSCVYINRLADVDLDVLEELLRAGWADMATKYPD